MKVELSYQKLLFSFVKNPAVALVEVLLHLQIQQNFFSVKE